LAGELAAARRGQRIGEGGRGEIADPQAIEIIAPTLIKIVPQFEHVVAGFPKRAQNRSVFAEAGDVVAVGNLAARGVEQPQSGVEQRADPPRIDFKRGALSGFDVKFEVMQLLRRKRAFDRRRQTQRLGRVSGKIRRRGPDRGQIVEQNQPQRRNAARRRHANSVNAQRRLRGNRDAKGDRRRVLVVF